MATGASIAVSIAASMATSLAAAAPAQAVAEARFSQLPRKPVSDVKREGWRGVMRGVDAAGALLMTNHDQPEAVILSLHEYQRLKDLAESAVRAQQDKLAQLSQAFDEELRVLQQADTGSLLRQAFEEPLVLHGKLKAGQGF